MSTSSVWSSTSGTAAMPSASAVRSLTSTRERQSFFPPQSIRLMAARLVPDPRREPGYGESGNRAQGLSNRARASATAWRVRRNAEHLPQRPRRESGRARRISRVKQALPYKVSPTMLADTKIPAHEQYAGTFAVYYILGELCMLLGRSC